LNFQSFTAIRNIPNQLSVDPKNFSNMSDHENARIALFMANFIKLIGIASFLLELKHVLNIGPTTKYSALMNKLKWLKCFGITLLSRDCLIVGDNVFELYCIRPAITTLFLHESKLNELTDKKLKNLSLSFLWNVGVNSGKAALSTVNRSEEEVIKKHISFLLRNSFIEEIIQIGKQLSKG